jgi:branched-chain amino acid transport system permease protein
VTQLVQEIVDGLGVGSTYALLALGLAIIFGVMHLVNFAHGELITIGAYVIYGLSIHNIPWWARAPVVVVAAALAAVLIERVAFRKVRGSSEFTMLLTSFGVAIVIQALFRMYVSAVPRQFDSPGWINDTVELAGISIEVYDLVVIGVTAVTMLATLWAFQRTMFGVSLRAAAEDFDAARLMGVRADTTISRAFALSGALAGIAAVLLMLRAGQAEPDVGTVPLLKGVVAAVIGGLGSLSGAVLGGFLLGLAEVFFRSRLPGDAARLTDAFVFALIAILFIVRPGGLISIRRAERV